MKQIINKVLLLAVIGLSVSAFAQANQNEEVKKKQNKKDEKTIVFQVNLHCHDCVQKIEGNIPYEKGVKDLKVSLEKLECEVTFREDRTSSETLIEAFDKLGYQAKIKTDDPPVEKRKGE